MKTKKLMMVALVSSTLALSGCGAMSTVDLPLYFQTPVIT